MMKSKKTSDFSINSILGEGTSFEGVFTVSGPLRIDGNFWGKINSDGKVIIGKKGRAESIISAKTIIIGGTVNGDIFAEDKVLVLKTGEIIGNIYSCSVTIEDGVIFNGKCNIVSKENIKNLIEKKKKEKYNFK